MARIEREKQDALVAAIDSHDFLRRLLEALEHHHRLVFHANETVDWSLVRRSAEQILIAEIVTRHQGNFDGVYLALHSIEGGGKPWSVAIHELAGTMHSYFTTPLGIVMRSDLFGEDAVFISPEAYDWIRQRKGARARGADAKS